MKNYFAACAVASKITKVPAEEIRANFRKGAHPTGKTLNAVIIAKQIYNGTYNKAAEVAPETEQA